VENERLRLRIEALERLAAESRHAEETRREDEERRGHAGGDRERERPLRTTDYLATCAEEGRAPSPYARGLRYALTAPDVAALLALRLTRPSAR